MKAIRKFLNWGQPRLYWRDILNYYGDLQLPRKAGIFEYTPGSEKSVLVLSPHIDDEVIGLGGTLYFFHRLKIPVTVIYFSTGNARRRSEGEKIAACLGYQKALFYDFPEDSLSRSGKIPELLSSCLRECAFDAIYAPFFLDRHKDHIAVARHLSSALKMNPEYRAEIRCYEVWAPLFPNRFVDISAVVDYKREAIEICQSQMESLNYVDLALSMNRYRGITSSRERQMRYAEAFYCCAPLYFRKLLKSG